MAATTNVTCPRCGFEQPSATECARCGVIFAKLRAEPPRPEPVLIPTARPSSKTRSGGGLSLGGLVLTVAIGLVAVSVLKGGMNSAPLSFVQSLLRAGARPEPKPVRAPYTWYEGKDGYLAALKEAEEDGKPLVIYFYTDWCPNCHELNDKILGTQEARDKLRYLVKVRINPERGQAEMELAQRYSIEAYPSFFVQPSVYGGAKLINPAGRSPQEFTSACWSAARL